MSQSQVKESAKHSNSKHLEKSNGGKVAQLMSNTLMQQKSTNHSDMFENAPIQKKENKTGLPDQLKDGMENLSGQGLDDVKVHYNSVKPKAVQAHAYAQGSDIQLASGQEKHLPHELGHVVQQKEGKVQPTIVKKAV